MTVVVSVEELAHYAKIWNGMTVMMLALPIVKDPTANTFQHAKTVVGRRRAVQVILNATAFNLMVVETKPAKVMTVLSTIPALLAVNLVSVTLTVIAYAMGLDVQTLPGMTVKEYAEAVR
jgi:hypothetical protein